MFVEQKKDSVHNRIVVRSQKVYVNESALQSLSYCSNSEKKNSFDKVLYSTSEVETRRYFLFSF